MAHKKITLTMEFEVHGEVSELTGVELQARAAGAASGFLGGEDGVTFTLTESAVQQEKLTHDENHMEYDR